MMDDNQKMIEKNLDWAGKVKIVAIAQEYQTEYVSEIVNSKRWKSIEHYRLVDGYEDDNDLLKFLQLQDTTFVILINKWGKIVYLGRTFIGNLETRIIEEIKADQDTAVGAGENIDEKPSEAKQPETEELLTKEEFKQLKLQIQILQSPLKGAAIKGSVVVSLEKINNWKHNGQKEVLKRSRLTLDYNVNVSEEGKLYSFINNHWNPIPEYFRHVNQAKIRRPAKQLKEIQTKFQDVFSALGANINYCNQETTILTYQANKSEITAEQTSGFVISTQNLTCQRYKEGMNNLKDYLSQLENNIEDEENKEALDTITLGLEELTTMGEGKQFETIENYRKLGTEEYTKIEHVEGQVLLISYQEEWGFISGEEIGKNTQLFKQNREAWENKVKVVFLCKVPFDQAKEYTEMNQESQKYIDFYFPQEKDQIDSLKYRVYEFQSIYILVDKFGTIRKMVYNTFEHAHELITRLLQEEVPQQQNIIQQIEQDKISQLKATLLNEKISQAFAEFDSQHAIQLKLTIKKTLDEHVKIEMPELYYFIRDTQVQQFQAVLQKIFDIIPKENWNISKSISKTVLVEYPGNICVVCQKDISLEAQQYYSPFKSEHVCTECAEADDTTKIGIQRYKYHDTLIFINGPLSDLSVLKDIDDHKIGRNIKLKNGEIGSQKHHMNCNGCGATEVQGPRYISITACPGQYQIENYVDYCSKCFATLKNKNSEKAKQIVAKAASKGMIQDSLFTRVLFDYGAYEAF